MKYIFFICLHVHDKMYDEKYFLYLSICTSLRTETLKKTEMVATGVNGGCEII